VLHARHERRRQKLEAVASRRCKLLSHVRAGSTGEFESSRMYVGPTILIVAEDSLDPAQCLQARRKIKGLSGLSSELGEITGRCARAAPRTSTRACRSTLPFGVNTITRADHADATVARLAHHPAGGRRAPRARHAGAQGHLHTLTDRGRDSLPAASTRSRNYRRTFSARSRPPSSPACSTAWRPCATGWPRSGRSSLSVSDGGGRPLALLGGRVRAPSH